MAVGYSYFFIDFELDCLRTSLFDLSVVRFKSIIGIAQKNFSSF